MGLERYGLSIGCDADFVLVEASCVAEAVANPAPPRLVVKHGRIVGRDGRPVLEPPAEADASPSVANRKGNVACVV
jgi:cytosine deaminase